MLKLLGRFFRFRLTLLIWSDVINLDRLHAKKREIIAVVVVIIALILITNMWPHYQIRLWLNQVHMKSFCDILRKNSFIASCMSKIYRHHRCKYDPSDIIARNGSNRGRSNAITIKLFGRGHSSKVNKFLGEVIVQIIPASTKKTASNDRVLRRLFLILLTSVHIV